MSQNCVHLRIRGFVQGVGFRYFCYREADRLGLTGWVKNRPDGSVEAVAVGEREPLQSFLETVRRGPGNARVDTVDEDWRETDQTFRTFEVRH